MCWHSNMAFTRETYQSVFEAADKVFTSSRAVQMVAAVSLDETMPAFTPENQPPQVAAVTRGGRGRGRGPRGNRGGRSNRGGGSSSNGGSSNGSNQTGGQSGQARGQRHSSNPPQSCCDRHYRHGAEAWYCVAPLTCPWKDKCAPRA